MLPYKQLISITLLICGMASCSSPSGGCDGFNIEEEDSFMGDIKAVKDGGQWVPMGDPDSISFKNSLGGTFTFTVIHGIDSHQRIDFRGNTQPLKDICNRPGEEYLKCFAQSHYLSNPSIPFSLNFFRRPNLYNENYKKDTVSIDYLRSLSESIAIYIGGDQFSFNLKDSNNYTHGSINLFDSIYEDVYTVNRSGGQVTTIYLQRNKGLIGFTYFNNEKWVRIASY